MRGRVWGNEARGKACSLRTLFGTSDTSNKVQMSAFSTWRGEQEEGFVDDFVPEKNLLLGLLHSKYPVPGYGLGTVTCDTP